jgi:hypothetical protein
MARKVQKRCPKAMMVIARDPQGFGRLGNSQSVSEINIASLLSLCKLGFPRVRFLRV